MIAGARKATTPNCDRAEIVRAMRAVFRKGMVTEVRVLKGKTPQDRFAGTYSGYFDNAEALADAVAEIDWATGVYFVPNEVRKDLLARSVNKLRKVQSEPLTSDADIERRRFLLVDCDAIRPSGISASDEEHQAALDKAQEIKAYLSEALWPDPIEGNSGNGAHLLYAIDLPAQDDGLVQRCLQALAAKFTDERVKVDQSVFNQSRIWKLPGTWARKGDDAPDQGRPHRMGRWPKIPDELQVTPTVLLEDLAGEAPDGGHGDQKSDSQNDNPKPGGAFDIEAWMQQHGVAVQSVRERGNGSTFWILEQCVWNPDHRDKSAFICRLQSGAIAAGCKHDSCSGKGWRELRATVDPAWAEKQASWEQRSKGQFVPLVKSQIATSPSYQNDSSGDADDSPASGPPWPTPLGDAAFHGHIGQFVRSLEPRTEADPAGLLVQALVALGNCFGRNAYFQVEASKHYPNLFATLVGVTAGGRKGTSWGRIEEVFQAVAPNWAEHCVSSGLSSGEGLIYAVRDEVTKQEPVRDKGFNGKQRQITGYETVIADPGVADKRLLCLESEFGGVLRVMQRSSNTLSVLIRQCWDSGNLRTLTKNNATRATGAHVSVIGHITGPELRKFLLLEDAFGGVGNRFLWVCTQRSKLLPMGSRSSAIDWELSSGLTSAINHATDLGEVRFDLNAETIWCDVYAELSSGRPGLLGACTSRAEAQVVRLALLYALADSSSLIAREHIEAALEVWRYCFDSARYIFGDSCGDATADAILGELKKRGSHGLGRTEIVRLFGNNRPATMIDGALALLQGIGAAQSERVAKGTGRPEVRWYAV